MTLSREPQPVSYLSTKRSPAIGLLRYYAMVLPPFAQAGRSVVAGVWGKNMRRVFLSSAAKLGLALFAAATLGGCDGGGSESPKPAPSPTVNTPPQIQPTVYVTVDENVTGIVHTIAAADLEGDPLTFTISGGPDAGKFSIASNGALSFRTSPDYENPTDSDRNNVYAVFVTVSDGKASVEQLVGVTVRDLTAGDIQVRKVTSGFSQATAIQPVPGRADSLFVTERTGRVRIVTPSTGLVSTTPFIDVSAEIATDGNRGLTAFAPAPDFAQSRNVYVAMTTKAGELEVRRYKTSTADPSRVDPASADRIFQVANTDGKYVGGWIGFGPDGMLYISVGAPVGTGEDRTNLFGKILRVDVSADQFPSDPDRDYAIPADNPFAADSHPEIWIIGMLHPYGGSFDPCTGGLWINDYAHSSRSGLQYAVGEVNLVRPQDKGFNYAPAGNSTLPDGYVLPMVYTDFGLAPERADRVYTAGQVYRGPIEILQGRYIYDLPISSSYSWIQAAGSYQSSHFPNGAPQLGLEAVVRPSTGFGRDAADNLYIANSAGDLFIVELK